MKSSTNEGLDAKRDRRLLIDDPNKLTELYLFHTDTRFAPYKTNLHFYKNLLLRQFRFLVKSILPPIEQENMSLSDDWLDPLSINNIIKVLPHLDMVAHYSTINK